MAKMQLALVIGGAVASSVGAAFKNVEGRISKLEQKGNKAKVLKSTIGETMKLQAEWKRAHDAGAAGADKLLRKLNGNLDSLRKQGVEVGRLSREYQRLAREAKGADLQLKGHQQIDTGRSGLKSNAAAAAVGVGLAAVPTKISADYQAIIRDIAIKADAVNKPEEVQLSRTVIQTAKDTGMGRNDVADLINQLVGAGMELDKAMAYAPTAAKFAVGQGASGVDTASMIMALQQNAKISDPKVMEQALEAIAYQGQAGSFEASDMAKWFPQLLAGMEKNGITGMDSVASLGAMLQVQMKTAGSSDEAANNFKNWMEKIGSSDVVKAYKDAGIDYQASLNTGLQKGMNVIESSMALAMKYVEATDPAKAKKMKEAQANIDKEVDPEKAKAALEALEKTLRTGDLFADMQVKAALTAYAQNRGLYADLKADSQKATGILDKNLAERRETSSQQWAETAQAVDDAMRSIGDAIRPATDMAAKGLTAVAQGITTLSDKFPAVIMGLAGLAAGISGLLAVRSGARVARGAFNVARGRAWSARRGGKLEEAPAEAALSKTGNRVLDAGMGVLGKVFVDCNNNHVQDEEELGIPGVRLYFSDGTWLISDSEGKYSYCGLPPNSHTLKVDPSTLPVGARLTTSSNRNLGDADSLFLDLKNGELHRADFVEGSCSNPVLEQVKARRTQGEVRAPESEPGQSQLRFESKPVRAPQQATDSANQRPIVEPRPNPPAASASQEVQP